VLICPWCRERYLIRDAQSCKAEESMKMGHLCMMNTVKDLWAIRLGLKGFQFGKMVAKVMKVAMQ
jgi:hypothetical protein